MTAPLDIEHELSGPFDIEGWHVDPQLRRLNNGEVTVQLEPKVMEVLVCLARRPGEVLSRAEIMAAVWSDTHVGEDALNRAVSELRKLFGDNPRQPRVIETILKRGYRLMVPVTSARPENGARGTVESTPAMAGVPAADGPARTRRLVPGLAAASVLAAFALLLGWRVPPPRDAVVVRVLPITSYPGREGRPALSPDGQRVAFSWTGPDGTSLDIWVKQHNSEQPLRLTDSPSHENDPVWSPDGSTISFIRAAGSRCELLSVPAIGGPERRLHTCTSSFLFGHDWSPDGEHVVISDQASAGESYSLYLISLRSGEIRPLTDPGPRYSDATPHFSPDGRWVAFKRVLEGTVHELFRVPVEGGEPEQLTFDGGDLGGFDYAADGNSLIFSAPKTGVFALWRVTPGRGTEWLGFEHAFSPSVGPNGVVFERRASDISLWRLALPSGTSDEERGDDLGIPERFIASTRVDIEPSYSPDGTRIAFVSQRSGNYELWVADANGHGAAQLTFLQAPVTGWIPSILGPVWSPDGTRLVFSYQEQQHGHDLYEVASAGGLPRRLTVHPAHDFGPCWSQDGRLYFISSREDGEQIHVLDAGASEAEGAVPTRLTRLKAELVPRLACPRTGEIYYQTVAYDLRRLVIGKNGESPSDEAVDLELVSPDWTATHDGLYGIVAQKDGRLALAFYSFAAGRVEWRLALRDHQPAGGLAIRVGGLSVAPDGRAAVFARIEGNESDLVLVEGLR